MAKRSNVQGDSRTGVAGLIEQLDTVLEPWVKIRSLVPSHLFVAEDKTPSGNAYVWPQSGAEVEVHPDDVEWLLGKIRKGCCGALDYPYFELVK